MTFPKNYFSKKQKGFTILELIVAIAVLSFGVVLVYGSFYSVSTATQSISSKLIASNLAEEGVEIIRNLRNSNFISPSWQEIQLTPGVNTSWQAMASSSDGTHLVVGGNPGRLYLSSDAGTTWTETYPPSGTAVNQYWQSAASSADGTKLVVGNRYKSGTVGSGRLYISSNSGAIWTEVQPAGNTDRNWTSLASSSDGSVLLVGNQTTGTYPTIVRLYLSTNSGQTWTEVQPAGNVSKTWGALASSSDGTRLIAGAGCGGAFCGSLGRLYLSSNSGTTWTETQPAGNVDQYWDVAASSADGIHLIAGVNNGRLYLSSNSGTSWTETQPAGNVNQQWQSLASSSDGSHLMAGAYNGRLWLSSNYGATWQETQPTGTSVNGYWIGAISSFDGTKLMAVKGPVGRIYLYKPSWSSGLLSCTTGCIADYKTQTAGQLKPYDGSYLGLNSDGFYSYDTGGTPTIFQRRVTITPVSGTSNTLNVDVQVTWTYNGQSFSVDNNSYMDNWY